MYTYSYYKWHRVEVHETKRKLFITNPINIPKHINYGKDEISTQGAGRLEY